MENEDKLLEFLRGYSKIVEDRYNSLTEEEKRTIDETAGTPAGSVLEKLFAEILNRPQLSTGMDASDMPERAPARPFEEGSRGALLTEEEFKDRIKRDNRPVGNQMKTRLGTQ